MKSKTKKAIESRIVMNTGEVRVALRKRYVGDACAGDAYAYLEEVGNATGFRCNRHADAIVMSLWPSRGLTVTGFEIKTSRSDWVKELSDPSKADVIYGYCDHWFLVVGDENIVKEGELPTGWGLLVPGKNGVLYAKIGAAKNEPKPLDRPFVAAMLRCAAAQLSPQAQLQVEYERGYKNGHEAQERTENYRVRDYEELVKKVSKFEKAAGVSIQHEWNLGELGAAVRMVRNGIHLRMQEELGRLKTAAETIAKNVEVQMQILTEGKPKDGL